MPGSNLNKVTKNLQGLQHKSQLFSHAANLKMNTPYDVLKSEYNSAAIVTTLYKRGPPQVGTGVFPAFITVVITCHGGIQLCKIFEVRIFAAVSRYSAHGSFVVLPGPFRAFLHCPNLFLLKQNLLRCSPHFCQELLQLLT